MSPDVLVLAGHWNQPIQAALDDADVATSLAGRLGPTSLVVVHWLHTLMSQPVAVV